MAEAPLLSLVLACYNEAEHLERSFAEIRDTLEQSRFSFEILFVDDVSRDRTREIIASLVAAHPQLAIRTILHERNLGRGASVSDGFRAARGEIAGYIDVDLEVHSRYIPSLVRAIYVGLDPRLTRAAGLSVLAHLEDLVVRGKVATDGAPSAGGRYRLAIG